MTPPFLNANPCCVPRKFSLYKHPLPNAAPMLALAIAIIVSGTSLSLPVPLLECLPVRSTTIRCCAERCGASLYATHWIAILARTAVTRRECAVTCVATVHGRTLCSAKVAILSTANTCQLGNHTSELLLQDANSLGHDLVRGEAAHSLDVVEESGRNCFVVEGLVRVCGTTVQIYLVFVLWPGLLLVPCYNQK
jgi:hypothetical protein